MNARFDGSYPAHFADHMLKGCFVIITYPSSPPARASMIRLSGMVRVSPAPRSRHHGTLLTVTIFGTTISQSTGIRDIKRTCQALSRPAGYPIIMGAFSCSPLQATLWGPHQPMDSITNGFKIRKHSRRTPDGYSRSCLHLVVVHNELAVATPRSVVSFVSHTYYSTPSLKTPYRCGCRFRSSFSAVINHRSCLWKWYEICSPFVRVNVHLNSQWQTYPIEWILCRVISFEYDS